MNNTIVNRLKDLKPDIARYGIKRLRVFGSALRDDFTPDSDIDLLVEFEAIPSFFTLLDIQEDLEKRLNHKIDLVFPHKIFPELRDSILKDAVDV